MSPSKRSGTKSAPTAARPAISAFGDSVMLGAQSELCAKFGRCDVHAVEGQQPYVTLAEVRAEHDQGRLAALVVLHTGNNGIIRPSDLADTLNRLRDRQRVILLTDRVPRDWQAPNNDTIRRVAKKYGNVVLVDWHDRSNNSRDWFYDDGLHLRAPGAEQYANLIATAIGP